MFRTCILQGKTEGCAAVSTTSFWILDLLLFSILTLLWKEIHLGSILVPFFFSFIARVFVFARSSLNSLFLPVPYPHMHDICTYLLHTCLQTWTYYYQLPVDAIPS